MFILILNRDFSKHLSWGNRGIAVDAWNERAALEKARAERKTIVQAVKRVVIELEEQKRQILHAQMNEAKAQLAALRKNIKVRHAAIAVQFIA